MPEASSLADKALTLPLKDVEKLLAGKGKPGATTFSLKVVRFPDTGPDPVITFNAPEGRERAEADRERFKEHLFAASVANKEGIPATASVSDPAYASASGSVTPAPIRSASSVPGVQDASTLEQQRKDEIQLRIAVLAANPDLQALHRDLVFKKVMKDREFWAHPSRAALLRAERMARAQRRGRNARIADPRPTNDSEGNMSISLSTELVRDVFEQYPLVAKAYNELVPSELDEQLFWTRYFQSRLYHRLRTSARSAASEHITRADPLFDRYLADVVDDSELVSRNQHSVHDTFLDLGATELDHEETGNTRDFTMQAGYHRSNLPLLRHFNTHSTSLLDSALGEQAAAPTQRRTVGGVGEEYSIHHPGDSAKRAWDQIVIEELEPSRRKRARPLQVADDRHAFISGRDGPGENTELDDLEPEETNKIIAGFGEEVELWPHEAEDILKTYSARVSDNERAQAAVDALVRDHRASEQDGTDRGMLSRLNFRHQLTCHPLSWLARRRLQCAHLHTGSNDRVSTPILDLNRTGCNSAKGGR